MEKNKTYKILTCCGCGNGTCQVLAMVVKRVCAKLNMNAKVEPAAVSVGIAQGVNYDIIICNRGLANSFQKAKDNGTIVIGLINIMSEEEIIEKLNASLQNR